MRRTIRAAFVLAVFATVLFAVAAPAGACAAEADSADGGPFVVGGPPGSYRYEDSTLIVSGEGVTVAGMADEGPSEGNGIRIESGVSKVTFGSGVSVALLVSEGPTTLWLDGDGNAIAELDNVYSVAIKGSGSLRLVRCSGQADIAGATVTLVSEMAGATVWQGATLALEPGSRAAYLMVHGGTLDLSRIGNGPKADIGSYTIGKGDDPTSLTVPFGAESIDGFVQATDRFVGGAVDVYSEGELVGTLQDDGTIYYTATRTVTFTGFDGAVLKTEVVRLFQSAEAPPAPEQQGYLFAGWDRRFDRVTQDMTVAAVFEPVGGESSGSEPTPPSADRPAGESGAGFGNALPSVGDRAVGPAAVAAALSFAALVVGVRARRMLRAN